MAKVDIGIADSTRAWAWIDIMTFLVREQSNGVELGKIHGSRSALPDHNKNYLADDRREAQVSQKRRNELTDMNRVRNMVGFLSGDAEWLFQIDDDVAPPDYAITHLMNLGRSFVGGLYFLAKPPHNPIAYYRREDNLYAPLWNYKRGTLSQVDSIGMGCTLIHRSVFEDIQASHTVYQRPTGALFAIPNSRIFDKELPTGEVLGGQKAYVSHGLYHMPLKEVDWENDDRPWPFYAMEYGRTEDHHFCELAEEAGHKPWLDTNVVCTHRNLKEYNRHDYLIMEKFMQEKREGADEDS